MARRGRSAGRYHRGLADTRGAGGRARAIRAALCDGYNPGAVQAALAAGDPTGCNSSSSSRDSLASKLDHPRLPRTRIEAMSYADDRYDSMTGSTDATELATPVDTAELRSEATLVWQMMQHRACARISNLAAHSHGRPRRRALDAVAEHLRSAEKHTRSREERHHDRRLCHH